MTATWSVLSKNTLFAQNKCMISVFNASGSGVVLRLYRAWMLNNQLTAVTGVLTNVEIRKLSSMSGGTTLTPAPRDTSSTALPAQVTAATNASVTPTDLYRRVIWSTDEPAANATVTMDEFELIPSLNCIWVMGYRTTMVEPIVLREGQGFGIINTGAVVGQADLYFEFTVT